MAARSVRVDDAVRSAGCDQLVILGAGYDTRAWRMDELSDVTVFEMDHPATQCDKLALAQARAPKAKVLHFVPVNFTRDSLDDALKRSDLPLPINPHLSGLLHQDQSGHQRPEPRQRFVHDLAVAALLGLADPLGKRDAKNGDARFGSEAGIWLADTTLPQRLGERGRQRGHLDELTLAQIRMGRDHRAAQACKRTTLFIEEISSLHQRGGQRGKGGGLGRHLGQRIDQGLLKMGRAIEQHLALVGKVAKESARRQPRALRDGGYGRLFVTDFSKQFNGGSAEAALGIGFPAAHGAQFKSNVLTQSDIIGLYSCHLMTSKELLMRILVTGASGWIGSASARELIAAGHHVLGLARSDESAAKVAQLGAQVVRGSLDDLASLRSAAEQAEGVVHLGYNHDFSQMAAAAQTDRAAIELFADVLQGTGGPLLIASGLLGLATGRVGTETDMPNTASHPRSATAAYTLGLAERGIRSMVVRFAPTVHGAGGDHGFVATLARTAYDKGISAYIGDGQNRWPAVHRLDAARLVQLAIAKATPGSVLHAVAEEGVAARDIASALGQFLDLPVVSIPAEQAQAHFGWMAMFFGADIPASSARTRSLLGWEPTHETLLADIAAGHYPGH